MLNTQSPNKYIPIFFDEYNISWDWTTVDQRTTSNKGGVFSALVMVTTVDNGADVSNRWNESEPAFAFMNNQGVPYTVAHVYRLFNQFCYGDQVTATTTDAKSVVAYAVKSATRHSLVLINRAATQQTANVTFSGWTAAASLKRYQVWTRNGIDSSSLTWTSGSNAVILPDNSVTVLTVSEPSAVKPATTAHGAVSTLQGPITAELYSLSGRLLSKFTLNASGTATSEALALTARSHAPSRVRGAAAYFVVLKTASQQLRMGPFLSNTGSMK
jgi:hypothetical protein